MLTRSDFKDTKNRYTYMEWSPITESYIEDSTIALFYRVIVIGPLLITLDSDGILNLHKTSKTQNEIEATATNICAGN